MPFILNDVEGKKLRIGDKLFEKRWVESIRKAEGHKPEICSASIDFTAVKDAMDDAEAKVARLYIYVGLEGSEESIYANDWYRKGMPLSVSFTNGTAKDMVDSIVDTVKRFNVFTKVKKVLDVAPDTKTVTTLVINGTHEYQRLQKIKVLIDAGDGEETAIVDFDLNHKEDAAVTAVTPGINGFGTYSQLIKDLRLPTAAHTGWNSVQKGEMPVMGAIYDQYIITYFAPSMANPSFTAIGNRSMSETTHVFWVNRNAVAKDGNGDDTTLSALWEDALKTIDPDGEDLTTITVSDPEATIGKRYDNKKTKESEAAEA
jgi:hypothetical protein